MYKQRKRVLFILKKRTIYSEYSYSAVNSGLFNSATFVEEMLYENGIDSSLIEVNDNNEIDKYVTQYRPDIVIIEALWVVPSKFKILQKLHPNVKWIIRLHSEIPFLANEGIAIDWLKKYVTYSNVQISSNSKIFIKSMEPILGEAILYLPNYYPNFKVFSSTKKEGEINVGCFGALRPMKNTLTQAVASILYAESKREKLRFHINTERVEQQGENMLKNIRALFEDTHHELVEHKWLKHYDFLKLVAKMDVGLQVSLSETYNIVAADIVGQHVPIVTSTEIPFVTGFNQTSETKDAVAICDKIKKAILFKNIFTCVNKILLQTNSKDAKKVWLNYLKK